MLLLVPAYPGSPGGKAVKQWCVCVCACALKVSASCRPVADTSPLHDSRNCEHRFSAVGLVDGCVDRQLCCTVDIEALGHYNS